MSSILVSRIGTSLLALVCAASFASAAGAQVIQCQYVALDGIDPPLTILDALTPDLDVIVTSVETNSLGHLRKVHGTADTLLNNTTGDLVDGFFQAGVEMNVSSPNSDGYSCVDTAQVRGNGVVETGVGEVLIRTYSWLDGQRRRYTSLDCIPGDNVWDGRACSVHPVYTQLRVSEQDVAGQRLVIDRARVGGTALFELITGESPGSGQGLFLICECLLANGEQ